LAKDAATRQAWIPDLKIDSPPSKKARKDESGRPVNLNPFDASGRYYTSAAFESGYYAFYHRAVPVKRNFFI